MVKQEEDVRIPELQAQVESLQREKQELELGLENLEDEVAKLQAAAKLGAPAVAQLEKQLTEAKRELEDLKRQLVRSYHSFPAKCISTSSSSICSIEVATKVCIFSCNIYTAAVVQLSWWLQQ